MLLSRANLKGGKPLKHFPLESVDDVLGYKIGYCINCNESIHIKTLDARLFSCHFQMGEDEYKNLLKKLRPKIHWKDRLIKWLGGYVASSQLPVENFN